MLINDFFAIKEVSENEKECVYRLTLNAGHPIYHAHFQGNPITPGACIIQMVKELAENYHSTSFFIRSVKNVKFLCVINPLEHTEIDIHLTFRTDEVGMIAVSAVIDKDKAVFCKLNLVLETRQCANDYVLSSHHCRDVARNVSTNTDENNKVAVSTVIDRGKNAQEITELQSQIDKLRICIIIPTYNNANTLSKVLNDVLNYTNSVIVVNDGSTDGTNEILEYYAEKIDLISYNKNKGKGHALKCGFNRAEESGYRSAITLDSDGQHFASDIKAFVELAATYPGDFLTGQRIVEGQMPSGNNFANKFSNFWFTVQTGRRLKDTQNGFRLYPLAAMHGMRPLSSRFEAEIELLVRSAWKGISIRPVPVHVFYPPKEERVSHFRPGKDFLRISLLNTCLVFLALLYGYPSMLYRKLFKQS